ncbi:FAD-dependent oxidoreductase [Gordonia sp. HY285]|uniref:FAD-dependent oxidoreductase n=1 Tax=Gordonia liuliyuniae TaxID=2911517 RepID=UPI001F1DEBF9|nr:FAD-dependent oxidoreductase [Gordonia liuliyuniae]MCF8609203.1 FAD-dependent oxidoreductase [Gordonia liuliyuniae]
MGNHTDLLRDVVVIGGGAAGLSAALTLARARRTVTVVDAGAPRNAPADGVHGLLALDGVSPIELLARGRDEFTGYGGEIIAGEVVEVSCASYGFRVVLRDESALLARRLLIATGLVDQLPDIPGVRDQWGRGVLHCPYCHGWEVRDRRIGVLGTDAMAVHKAVLFRQWSADVVYFAHTRQLDPEDRVKLDALGIDVVDGTILRLETVDDRLTGVRLHDETVVPVDAVVVSTQMVARAELVAGLGIEPASNPAGAFIETDQFGATSVPGVWAAGNSSDIGAQVGAAAAAGALAAQHINTDLIMRDLDDAVSAAATETGSVGSSDSKHAFDNDYWDRIWQGDRAAAMGSGQPNPHLVREVGGLTPGTALEAGCGAGAEAIWLAERGWQVTGADIAAAALDRAAERAGDAGVAERVEWVQADLSTWAPDQRYDLVTTHYAHPAIPQLEFYDRLASWVAPAGTLLIVGHLHHDAATDRHRHESDGPPVSASATAATVIARLDPVQWEIVTAEESRRTVSGPECHETTIHDVVVRAFRRR